jgi:hypothetical protein
MDWMDCGVTHRAPCRPRVGVAAASDDHAVSPVDEVEVGCLVLSGEVTSPNPTVSRDHLRIDVIGVEVVGHLERCTDLHPVDVSRGALRSVLSSHPNFGIHSRMAARAHRETRFTLVTWCRSMAARNCAG